MTERKVLNKYFPPDYDPSKIPRLPRGKKNRVFSLRTMAPFNMRCLTCKAYIYKARKFNSRMEPVDNEDYLGLRIYRFYIRCSSCCSEISWKTDIANNDYSIESGAVRTFEATRTAYKMAMEKDAQMAEDEKNNPMLLLENRTKQSKREMDQLEILEDLRDSNKKHANLDLADRVLEEMQKEKDKEQKTEREEFDRELERLVEEQEEKQKSEDPSTSFKMPVISQHAISKNNRKRKNPLANIKSSIIIKKRAGVTNESHDKSPLDIKSTLDRIPDVKLDTPGSTSESQTVIPNNQMNQEISEAKPGIGSLGLLAYSSSDDSE